MLRGNGQSDCTIRTRGTPREKRPAATTACRAIQIGGASAALTARAALA
jgi:hypothetical protein